MKNDQVSPAETALILDFAAKCLPLDGDFVELGCYRGDTSVLLGKLLWKTCGKPVEKPASNVENLCKTAADSVDNLCKSRPHHLWIYDSFAGLPAKTIEDNSSAGANFQQGELAVTKREVIEKLRKNGLKTASHLNQTPENPQVTENPQRPTVIVKKAWFNNLVDEDLPSQIAFAFLDGDLYDSIKTSLRLVAPRLTKQGIMVVHDYNNPHLPGAAKAVDEFLRSSPTFHLEIRQTIAILTKKC